jgi:hypothetical protein
MQEGWKDDDELPSPSEVIDVIIGEAMSRSTSSLARWTYQHVSLLLNFYRDVLHGESRNKTRSEIRSSGVYAGD